MKFLIDAQLPPALCGWLRERGHEAVHVFEIGMVAASDVEIATRAAVEVWTLISKDEDFATLRLPIGSASSGCVAATPATAH